MKSCLSVSLSAFRKVVVHLLANEPFVFSHTALDYFIVRMKIIYIYLHYFRTRRWDTTIRAQLYQFSLSTLSFLHSERIEKVYYIYISPGLTDNSQISSEISRFSLRSDCDVRFTWYSSFNESFYTRLKLGRKSSQYIFSNNAGQKCLILYIQLFM